MAFHRDQLMNGDFKRVGRGAMKIADALQFIERPGERMCSLMFLVRCLVDKHKLNITDLIGAVGKMEQEAIEAFSPELSGARAYIENEVKV